MLRKLAIVSLLMLMLVVSMGAASAQEITYPGNPYFDNGVFTTPPVTLGDTGYVAQGYRKVNQADRPGFVWRIEVRDAVTGEGVCRTNGAGERGEITGNAFLLNGQIHWEVIHHKKGSQYNAPRGNWCRNAGINVGDPNYEVYFDTEPRRIYLYAAGSEVVSKNWLSRTNGSGEFGNVLNLFSQGEYVYLVVDHDKKGCILEQYDPYNPFRIGVVDNYYSSTLCNVDAIAEQERNLEGEGS